MVFLSDVRRSARPAELICTVVRTVLFMIRALITIAANRRLNESWRRAVPIFVIFLNSGRR